MTVEMGSPLAHLEEGQAREACAALYWEPMAVEALEGYEDRTFLLRDGGGTPFVLKLSEDESSSEIVDLQNEVLEYLAGRGETSFPRAVLSARGRALETFEIAGARYRVRMLTFVPGVPLASLSSRPERLLRDLGRLVGRLDTALAELDAGAGARFLEWDIARVAEMPDLARFIEAPARRRRVEAILEAYAVGREDRHDGLRRSLIHNDVNDHNVMVTPPRAAAAAISGLIDFGDLVESDTVVDLAVAMAYAGLGESDPWLAVQPVLGGFLAEHPLTDSEVEILFPAFCARLALSVSMSARRRAAGLADEYALVSEKPAWAAIESMAGIDPEQATDLARRTAAAGAWR